MSRDRNTLYSWISFLSSPLPPAISTHQSPGEWVPSYLSSLQKQTFVKLPSLFLKAAQEVGLTKKGLSKHELGQEGFGSGGWAKKKIFIFF